MRSFVPLPASEILLQSKLRNLHSKKARATLVLQQQHLQLEALAEASIAAAREREARGAAAKATGALPPSAAMLLDRSRDAGEEEEGEEGPWDRKGTKARRKERLRRARQGRMHRGPAAGDAGSEEAQVRWRASEEEEEGGSTREDLSEGEGTDADPRE